MRYTPPKLTPAEQRKMDAANDRRNKKAQAAREKAEKALEALRRKEDEIRAKMDAEIQAARAEFQAIEDAVYSAVFEEESRTGVQRDRAA
jgi:hypothetical protein